MVPDKFNMVDMGGIDLIMAQGEEVSGLYSRLVESIAQCRYQCLYNWYFDGIVIPPTYVVLEVNENDEVAINEGVVVSDDDIVHIYSLERPPEIIPLLAEENGVYNSPVGKDGFNPVTVDVPSYTPIIEPIAITENGTYTAPSGLDGYSPITVNVAGSGEEWVSLVNYIESSGGQYINTGYIPKGDTYIEVVANVPDNASAYPAIYGARNNVPNEVVIFAEFGGGAIGMIWATGDSSFNPTFWSRGYIGKKCNYQMGGNEIVGIRDVDGYGFKGARTVGASITNLPLFLFALNDNGSPNSATFCTMKLYRMRIYESDILVHEFLPWQENGVVCLKDTVTGNLFYNAGTGNFVYGTDQ